MNVTEEVFLQLVRLGIGTLTKASLPENVIWDEVIALADRQGLSAIMLDGIDQLPENQRPPQMVLLNLIGEVLQRCEYRYDTYKNAIKDLALFYHQNGFKMMVLKGYACSLDWPKPEHRPCGDIDIWQFGQQIEADALLVSKKDISIDSTHHHHTVFDWEGFMVENHYDFINVHDVKSSRELEVLFKDLGKDDMHYVEINNVRIYLPSPNLHALFLMRHMVSHFASTNVTLRQVLDWAFFVRSHKKEIDWEWLIGELERFHMNVFFNCINAICVEELGFESIVFNTIQFDPFLKDRVFSDIIYPKYTVDEPKGLLPRLIYKYRRWKGNEWKRKICYAESSWSSFWGGVKLHLMKPASI